MVDTLLRNAISAFPNCSSQSRDSLLTNLQRISFRDLLNLSLPIRLGMTWGGLVMSNTYSFEVVLKFMGVKLSPSIRHHDLGNSMAREIVISEFLPHAFITFTRDRLDLGLCKAYINCRVLHHSVHSIIHYRHCYKKCFNTNHS